MKNKGYILIGLGVILLASAIGLLLYNRNLEKEAQQVSDIIVPKLQEVIEKNKTEVIESAKPKIDKSDSTSIDGHKYAGILKIPVLQLELPVLKEYRYRDLKIAPCFYSGDTSGHLVIAAHNYKSHFGNLSKLTEGDEVSFTDISGQEFQYKVAVMEELDSKDNDVLTKTDWDLTLFTCNFLGDKRITVRCKKADS